MCWRGRLSQPSASALLGEVGVSVGAGPPVSAVGGAVVGPGGEGLEPVVSSAEAGDVGGGGLAGGAAFVGRYVGVDVGPVAVARVGPSARGNAGAGPGEDLFA